MTAALIAPLFILDEPQYHRLTLGEPHRLRGAALALEGPPIERLTIYRGGELLVETAVNLPCPELAGFAFPNAPTSRFECEVPFDAEGDYEILGGDSVPLFVLTVTSENLRRAAALGTSIAAFPLPSPELIYATQGGTDSRSYADSAVSGFLSIDALLRMSGCDPSAVTSVLDIGCGTGRLLVGWHADDPSRTLAGVDLNGELIAWNQQHLGGVADWRVSEVLPPLPFADATFDVIQLVSVFTHLPLDVQSQWLIELRRLLRPGGAVWVSLHGDLYARAMLDETLRRQFANIGYVEVAGGQAGENAFSTFHSPDFARRLFADFPSVFRFPRGNPEGRPRLYPAAALQDVYVLRT